MDGIKVGGVNLTNLRYADDTALFADSEEKLQAIVDVVMEESERMGLRLNREKTVVMVCSKKASTPDCSILIQGVRLKQVECFQYLGSWVTSDARCDKDIKSRIGLAKVTYRRMERLLASRTVSIGTRVRVLKGYVWSTLLYGCEAWTISRTMEDRLAAAEMWFYRRMLRIPWKKRVTNEEVLKRANVARALITTIIRRQTSFLGHVMRKQGLEHRAVTAKSTASDRGEGEEKRFSGGLEDTIWMEDQTLSSDSAWSARLPPTSGSDTAPQEEEDAAADTRQHFMQPRHHRFPIKTITMSDRDPSWITPRTKAKILKLKKLKRKRGETERTTELYNQIGKQKFNKLGSKEWWSDIDAISHRKQNKKQF